MYPSSPNLIQMLSAFSNFTYLVSYKGAAGEAQHRGEMMVAWTTAALVKLGSS